MKFASDNWAGVHPAINEALVRHNPGLVSAYGTSDLDRELEKKFNDIFEREVAVFFVGTGTAANSMAMAACGKTGGIALCHSEAHVAEDEGGAPEFFSNGNRLMRIAGEYGRLDVGALKAGFGKLLPVFIHHGRPTMVTISQATEIGTTYDTSQIAEIAEISHSNGVRLHMDGARFANALVNLGVSPAEMTWKAGVDLLSFGGTKNGCWCAEALVCFDPDLAEEIGFLRKRAGHLFSKSRFIAAQFDAYLADDLWLGLARHANGMASRLADALEKSPNARLAWKPGANQAYAIMERTHADAMIRNGAVFFEWDIPQAHRELVGEGEALYRLVTNFGTSESEIESFADLLNRNYNS